MDKLSFGLELKELSEDGSFEGYASVFGNRDYGGDIVVPGAFKKTLERKGPKQIKMLADHDPTKRVGVWDEMTEDDHGLFVKGRLLMQKQIGQDAYIDLKEQALDGMSIGYRVMPKGYEFSRDKRVRKLKEVDLFEVSLVTFPMNPEATVTAVKADQIQTIREFEEFLRDVGNFSHAAAKSIAREGFKGSEPRDEDEAEKLADLLQRNIKLLSSE